MNGERPYGARLPRPNDDGRLSRPGEATRSTEVRWVRVGISEFAVSDRAEDMITTAALGSCVAVCVWEPMARIAGLLHFLLPDSKINPARARLEPAAFADSGIPLLFHDMYRLGGQKKRCNVRLVGGAEISGHAPDGILNVGRRNILAARGILWRNGLMVDGEAVGGTAPRTVILAAATGRLTIKMHGSVTEL